MQRRIWAPLVVAAALAAIGCGPPGGAVPVKIAGEVKDAQVTIDDRYIGSLGYVSKHKLMLPAGPHRLTVEKPGFFPFDTIIEATGEPVEVKVELVRIPD